MTALSSRTPERFDRPHPAVFAIDPVVGGAEYVGFAALLPLLLRLPKGDGRPVLVLPGFTASDRSTAALRFVLTRLNYKVYGWQLGQNLGPTPEVVDGLLEHFDEIHRSQGQPVTLVGWSLGGLYSRALAARTPEAVRHVITLGSPFRLARSQETNAGLFFDLLAPLHRKRRPHATAFRREPYRGAPKVPSTAIFTRGDGVVPWQACIDVPGPRSENVEVFGSHIGLGHNPAVVTVIADRLQLGEGEWRPFTPGRLNTALYRAKPYRLEA